MKNLFKRILITLGIVLVFTAGNNITVPGIDNTLIKMSTSSSNLLSIISMVSGGALESMSIFALGVGPYISASIIIELLCSGIVPPLKQLTEEGAKGRKKLNQYTRYLSLFVAVIQSIALIVMMQKNYSILTDATLMDKAYVIICLTAGMCVVMWLGDLITEFGLGNGVSMIIFAGIVARIPINLLQVYNYLLPTDSGLTKFIIYSVTYLITILVITFIEFGERRILTQQTHRFVSRTKGDFNYLPIKVNSVSVMPVIFAATFMSAIPIIMSILKLDETKFETTFSLTSAPGLIMYSVLIIFFGFFYANFRFNTKDVSEKLEKNGTYIPGIRPGKETEDYLFKVLNSVNALGILILLAIALLPNIIAILTGIPSSVAFGGNGTIIAVGVAASIIKNIETIKETESYDSYRGF